VKNTERDVNM